MRKKYESPRVAVERFTLTQHLASCSGIRINSTGIECVLRDSDATPGMTDLAYRGYFMDTTGCEERPVGMDNYDGVCYNTSSNMAFTS